MESVLLSEVYNAKIYNRLEAQVIKYFDVTFGLEILNQPRNNAK